MDNKLVAEDYLDSYLNTLNPFEIKLSKFEYLRVKLLIRKKLEEEKSKEDLYLLDAYLDIVLDKKEISPFYARLLIQKSSLGNGLASYIIYSCYKKKIQPFISSKYENYIYVAAKNNFELAYEEVINLFIINKSKLSKEETLKYVNKITDKNLKKLYLTYFSLDKEYIESDDYDKPICYYLLGKMYEEGNIFKKDINKAIEYYSKGAYLKEINSINRLATIYKEGLTGVVDISKALYYFSLSSDLDSSNIIDLISLKLETEDIPLDELNIMIDSLKKLNSEEGVILLGRIYLEYPVLKKQKEGLYLISYYALTKPNLYYDLYKYHSKYSNRKEAIRNLRRGVVKKDPRCIEEARGYKKLFSLIH